MKVVVDLMWIESEQIRANQEGFSWWGYSHTGALEENNKYFTKDQLKPAFGLGELMFRFTCIKRVL